MFSKKIIIIRIRTIFVLLCENKILNKDTSSRAFGLTTTVFCNNFHSLAIFQKKLDGGTIFFEQMHLYLSLSINAKREEKN